MIIEAVVSQAAAAEALWTNLSCLLLQHGFFLLLLLLLFDKFCVVFYF